MASHRVATSASLDSHRHPDPVAGARGNVPQCLAARVLLGVSQEDVAAKVALKTFNNIEQRGLTERSLGQSGGRVHRVGIESSPESGASLGGGASVHLMKRWPDERVGEPAEQQS